MLKRISLGAVALAGLAMAIFTGCSATRVDSIQISPASQSLAVGQTVQFKATGVVGHGQHPSSSEDVTTMVTWTSSSPAIASVNSTGLATGVSAGTATITASMNGFPGVVSATATLTVTGNGTGGNPVPSLVSISILPGSQSVATPGSTGQFLAIGTTSTGSTENVTANASWGSSSSSVATINGSGLATGTGQGTATITAVATNPDNTVATGTATFTVQNSSTNQVTALSLIPGSQSMALNQTGQLIALGTMGSSGVQQDLTTAVAWSSSNPAVATVGTASTPGTRPGLVTGVSPGTTTITAEYTNAGSPGGVVTSSAAFTVAATASEPLLSLQIVPVSQQLIYLDETAQFLAIGTFASPPYTRDLTDSVTWVSSAIQVATINTTGTSLPGSGGNGSPAGLATVLHSGTTAITAIAQNPDGSQMTAASALTCTLCTTGSNPNGLATLTIYGSGNNTTTWEVTAPSATGTPDVIHCGPGSTSGGSVCVGSYPLGSTVTLTTTTGSFGGWTANCKPVDANGNPSTPTAAGPNYCQVTLSNADTVGAIFN